MKLLGSSNKIKKDYSPSFCDNVYNNNNYLNTSNKKS
jgi:hypothetical protein